MLSKAKIALLVMVGLLVMMSASTYAKTGQQVERPEYVSGEVLLKLKDGVNIERINEINRQFNTQTINYFRNSHIFHLKLPPNLTVNEVIPQIESSPLVEYVTPNGLYYLDVTPNDPQGSQLWGLHNFGQSGGTVDADIDALEAWDITTGSNEVVIAVIDSGAQLNHPDLAANLWTNPGEIPNNGIDDDNNGFVDDVHGWDFSSNDNDPSPVGGACGGHGTHTAGTIGAVGNNGVGVTGVNWNVKLMPLKAFSIVFGSFCSASDADLIAAVDYYTLMGVRISSNSYGGGGFNLAMQDAIRASNSVFVAAAGNEGSNNDSTPQYPSNYDLDNIISVAATDRNDNRASFSNYGINTVDLGAPGVDILSTLPNSKYGNLSGTSMATPHVAGVAGLLLAQDPDLTVYEVKWRILNGVDNIGLPVVTGGRLNAFNTLQFGLSQPTVAVDVTPLGSTVVTPGETILIKVTVTNNGQSSIDGTFNSYVRLEDGREIRKTSKTGTLSLGQTKNITQTGQIPPTMAPGTTFDVFYQVETAVSFDEDSVEYTVGSTFTGAGLSDDVYLPVLQVD
ncbi:MAG: S8 family serine peptidase [Anaerolineales bacterium]|nr:S8 family serine peptidase [Anaerolineales bacterium]